jgi:hypothetical protein
MARFAEAEALADLNPAAAAAALEEARQGAQEVGNRFVAGTALTATVAFAAATARRTRRSPCSGTPSSTGAIATTAGSS